MDKILEDVSVVMREDVMGERMVYTPTGRYTKNPNHFKLYTTPGQAATGLAQREAAMKYSIESGRDVSRYTFHVIPLHKIMEVLNG